MIEPLGSLVLIKAKKVENVTSGGIVLPEDLTKKEQAVESTGEIVAFGPTAFKRWKGCESPRWLEKAIEHCNGLSLDPQAFNAICDYWKWDDPEFPAHKQWGLEIGDFVEHKRYEGKDSVVESDDGEVYRYIPDIQIWGKINGEST